MDKNLIIKRGLVISTLLVSTALSLPVLAQDGSGSRDGTTATKTETENETTVGTQRTAAETQAIEAEHEAARAEKLDEVHKRACAAHQAGIKQRGDNFADHVGRQLQVFDDIAAKVEAFATSKNRKPANYDALVADLTAKRAVVVTDLGTLKAATQSFSCDANNPKGIVKTVLADAKLVRADLKAYRTAVRKLIEAVKATKPADTTSSTNSTEAKQ